MAGMQNLPRCGDARTYETAAIPLPSHPDEEGTKGCPISTKGAFSTDQINRMKYNAVKESAAHVRLKGIIRDSLYADSACSEP